MPRLPILILGAIVLVAGSSAALLQARDEPAGREPGSQREHAVAPDQITVRSTQTLVGDDVTNGGVAARGRFSISGALTDTGSVTDYRTVKGGKVLIRRVAVGAGGTITFLITIHLGDPSPAPWKITSGTRAYEGLHGKGRQVVDRFYETPATFVLKGTVVR